jgi:hypothetical protein
LRLPNELRSGGLFFAGSGGGVAGGFGGDGAFFATGFRMTGRGRGGNGASSLAAAGGAVGSSANCCSAAETAVGGGSDAAGLGSGSVVPAGDSGRAGAPSDGASGSLAELPRK